MHNMSGNLEFGTGWLIQQVDSRSDCYDNYIAMDQPSNNCAREPTEIAVPMQYKQWTIEHWIVHAMAINICANYNMVHWIVLPNVLDSCSVL